MTGEFTINLHKRLHRISFKKKAARAVREIKKFATQVMRTGDVRVEPELNKFIWSKGVRNVPYRVRVKLSRRRNEDEEAAEKVAFQNHDRWNQIGLIFCADVHRRLLRASRYLQELETEQVRAAG